MVFSPMETGQTVEYTPEQVISDISWTDAHPIKQVYMNCNCNTGQRMWDVMISATRCQAMPLGPPPCWRK